MVLAAVLMAIGMVLPLLTAQIKEIGDTLLPMHIPVLLCGLLCGPVYGGAVGMMLPFLRSISFGMPPLYPNAVWMAFELATYGLVIGLIWRMRREHRMGWVYFSLVIAMVAGRCVWGITKATLLGLKGAPFTMEMFLGGAILDAIPGILLQLVLIPFIMELVRRMQNK